MTSSQEVVLIADALINMATELGKAVACSESEEAPEQYEEYVPSLEEKKQKAIKKYEKETGWKVGTIDDDLNINCKDCTDCKNCWNCSHCVNCENCEDCDFCNSCKECKKCRYCDCGEKLGGCTHCIECRECNNCIFLRDCTYCEKGEKVLRR